MICRNCFNEVSDDLSFCPHCQVKLEDNNFNQQVIVEQENNTNLINENLTMPQQEKKKRKINKLDIFVIFIVIGIWITIFIFIANSEGDYYFKVGDKVGAVGSQIDEDMFNYVGVSKSNQTEVQTSLGITSIVYDYQYLQQLTLKDINDVRKLVATDSIKQKTNCPNEIIEIEEEIINNYGIVAVNFCEMNKSIALELRDIIKYIYYNFPKARDYLTNITLGNVGSNESYVAAFMPVFTFATSKTSSGYPVAIKTQIILNAKYFLNASKLKNSVSYGEQSGYFPPNANGSSTVAHEFGHYLSYVAMLNYYKTDKLNFVTAATSKKLYEVYDDFNLGNFSYELIKEAYDKYQTIYKDGISFDEFRESISTYAMAKDNQGRYIYDETIAEAFHDCFLNGDKAKTASKMIVNVLKERL